MPDIVIPENLHTLSYPERIRVLTELAGRADPDCRVFGSKTAAYKYAAPADVQSVRDFELRTGIILPREYFRFFTEIGNGGAGVDYGMFSLEKTEEYNRGYFKETLSPGPTLFDLDDPLAAYLEKTAEMERLDNENSSAPDFDEKYDALEADIIRGLLMIGTAGCTYDYFIVLKGKKAGRIGCLDWNMLPSHSGSPIMYDLTLSEWLEDHFRRIIQGEIVSRGSFDSVRYSTDIGFKRRASRPPEPPKPAPVRRPEPQPAPAPAPQPTPAPAPDPQPAPQPEPEPVFIPIPSKPEYRVGDFIRDSRYGNGMITNVVKVASGSRIISAEFVSAGLKSLVLPYDEKYIVKDK